MRRVSIPIPDGEVDYWVKNAAKNFGITEGQFLMVCLQNAWEHLYGKTITWREFTLIETKKLEKLESLASIAQDNLDSAYDQGAREWFQAHKELAEQLGEHRRICNEEHIPGECGIHCSRRNSE